MENAKHTPGPWEAKAATTPEGTFSYWLYSPAYGAVGYWCGHKSHHTNNYWLLTESDAHLIAAAPEFLSGELLDAVGLAIEQAGNPGREGPFGFFDYTSYGDPVPFHVRDFRDPKLDGYGKCVFKTTDRSEGLAAFERETRRHIARSAMSALLAATTPKGNDDAK